MPSSVGSVMMAGDSASDLAFSGLSSVSGTSRPPALFSHRAVGVSAVAGSGVLLSVLPFLACIVERVIARLRRSLKNDPCSFHQFSHEDGEQLFQELTFGIVVNSASSI